MAGIVWRRAQIEMSSPSRRLAIARPALSDVLPLLVVIVVSACGGPSPTDPGGPRAGGAVTGRYALNLIPAAGCNGREVSFPVEVTAVATSPHAGVQLLLVGADPALLELELKYTTSTLEGGVGTTADGVPSNEGPQTWVNAIANGPTYQTSDGRGEVISGTLRGYLEIEGVMNACSAPDHSFTLRAR
jgi:hypothetical protein